VDESLFTNLINFFKAISCLPHSSAAAERLFSHLTTMKTKYRNKLDVSTCDALLLTKQITCLQINLYLEQPMEVQLFATFLQRRK
jgi:hypothetical protein